MPLDIHTSERTSLGYVLQLLVEEALKRSRIRFSRNSSYHEHFIMPDALLPGIPPRYSVHVTCTGADNSFQMKRWRYIDEILQMRSVYGNTFVAINVMFGPLAQYQAADRALIERLFDQEVVVDELSGGRKLFDRVLAEVRNAADGETSPAVASRLLTDPSVSNAVDELAAAIKDRKSRSPACGVPESTVRPLIDLLNERKRGIATAKPLCAAFWKRTMLRFLAVPPQYWEEAIALKGTSVDPRTLSPELVEAATRAKLLTNHRGIVVRVALDSEAATTLDAGLDLSFLRNLKDRVATDPRRTLELKDLWDKGRRANQAVAEVARCAAAGARKLAELISFSVANGGSPQVKHHRAHVLDVINVALGWSQNRMQEEYTGPGIGVIDPIRNIIPRTDIARQALTRDTRLAQAIGAAIAKAVHTPLRAAFNTNHGELVKKYVQYRTYCLVKGSSIDPLEAFISDACDSRGWTKADPNLTSLHGLVGRTKTVFSAAAKKGTRRLLVKCLFGDTGADHKAEEMEARMRIVRTADSEWRECISVFVADGKWSDGNIKALRLGGWDHVITVKDFEETIAAL